MFLYQIQSTQLGNKYVQQVLSMSLGQKKKKLLAVLHSPTLISENWKKVVTVQKYTAPNIQNSKKCVFFFLRILVF